MIPSTEEVYPAKLCDPRSYRTDVFEKPANYLPRHVVRLIYCCPVGQWDAKKKRCKAAMKVHRIFREKV